MSLKTIELQVALPRTMEAGKVQEQLTQKPSLDQQQLAMLNQSEQEHNRSRSMPLIPSNESLGIHQHSKRDHPQNHKKGEQKNKNNEHKQKSAEHPYKGKHIDLSL